MRQLIKSMLPPRVLRAWRAFKQPPPAPQPLLGMTGAAEQDFYAECAETLRGSPGAIVDLGSWMGSTCLALARGLGNNSPPSMIYAFDRFIWEDWMNHDGPRVACDYLPGDSFLPEVRRRTQTYRDRITLIQADLTAYTWDKGDIKLLLVDAMKSAELATAVARSFFPSLRARGILIHQDFKHYYTPWIHILQYRLRDSFTFTRSVPEGTVAFEVTQPLPAAAIRQASDFTTISDDEADAAFEYSLSLIGEDGRAAIAAAHLMHFIHRREPAKARQRLARYSNPAFPSHYGFARATQQIEQLQASTS